MYGFGGKGVPTGTNINTKSNYRLSLPFHLPHAKYGSFSFVNFKIGQGKTSI